jgi:hypothetical protein
VKRTLTTVFGIAAICLALLGGVVALLGLVALMSVAPEHRALLVLERGICLAAKAGLLLAGVLVLMRSKLALPVLILTLLLSVADSVLMYSFFMGPIPDGMSAGSKAGRVFGRFVGLVLPPVLYVGLIVYLCLPKTRAELGSEHVEDGQRASG